MKKIAVVDDDLEMGRLVKDILTEEGFHVTQYETAAQALMDFKDNLPMVLITDLRMKTVDGMQLLRKVRSDFPKVSVIMMTAFGSVETAIEAMKNGAFHYIIKPFKNEELVLLTRRALENSRLSNENQILRQEIKKTFSLESIIGKSPAMTNLFEVIKRVSSATANILVSGESGTGKEVIARAIHNLGPRKSKAFVPVNVTAIPETLLESELFGHVKGSFTGAVSDKRGLFEEANGGTLFLDEIGDMSLTLQAKILRVLQDKQIRPVGGTDLKQIDVRIIAATHRDLKTMAQEGTFREDLFYRLNVIPVRVPALRERTEDIPLLVNHFISRFAAENASPVEGITPDALTHLVANPWPGNVRELENVMERAVVLSQSNQITTSEVMGSSIESAKKNLQQLHSDTPTLEMLEERYIKLILKQTNNQKEEAAKILGISRRTLYRKEQLYGMIPKDSPEPAAENGEK
jgi:two-component system, NtrC family, response regulator HydG